MKKIFLILIVVCIILTACGEQKNIPPVITSISPEQGPTATSTLTATPTNFFFNELPSSPTITPFPPYPNKQVVFEYYETGNLADYDVFFAPESCCSTTKLVLYDDGQMIIAGKSETYKQKVLSPEEIKLFLLKLDSLGFYSLESNQKHDPTDKLYEYGNNYQETFDGLNYCILVNADRPRNLCAYEPDIKFLIPKMKTILKYLDEYEPSEMTPYYPDRIFLSIQIVTPDDNDLSATAIPWDDHFPPLKIGSAFGFPNPIMYFVGDTAKEVYLLFKDTNSSKVFSQNGNQYITYIRVILPHEKVMNSD